MILLASGLDKKDLHPNLLKGAVIYGANASGKSNLVKAISYAKYLITRGKGPNKKLGLPQFKLQKGYHKIPTKFEFEISVDGDMYAYGFEALDTHIKEEWLHFIRSNRDEIIFERNRIDNEDSYKFGKLITSLDEEELQRFKFVSKGTRENQLFLSETIDRNIKIFSSIFNWFDDSLKIITPFTKSGGIEFKISEDDSFKQYVTQVLSMADTGIKEVRTDKVSIDNIGGLPDSMIEEMDDELDEDEAVFLAHPYSGKRFMIRRINGELSVYKILTVHECPESGDNIAFELEEESDGTRRLIELTPAIYEMTKKNNGSVYIIDEIDRSLHPHLTKLLVGENLNSGNRVNSQLVVTTHETSLLDVSFIRRDEVWFIKKDGTGASNLYSLSHFKPRYDKDIRKDYLLGRYGAIPFVSNFERLDRE